MELVTKDMLKEMSLDDVLDLPIDMIEDSKQFVLPPKGAYILTITESKRDAIGAEGKETVGVNLNLAVKSTIELSNPNDQPVAEGSEFNQFYGEGGSLQFFKTAYGPIGKALGATTMGELIDKLNGVDIKCVIGHRVNKDDPEKKYPQLKDIALAQ